MLSASGLVKRYGAHLAVAGVDLRIERGLCYGLLGPNGAGKTTTISMLVGILRPDAGTVAIDDVPVSPSDPAYKRRIGFVPQDLALYDDLSAEENLRLFGRLYGLSGARLAAGVAAALDLANLRDRARERVSAYSGGMKRRLNIAAALLHDPEIVVLDEPTVGVDPQSRNAIFDALEALKARGKTLVYTTHYMEEVERLCDRIAIVDAGRVVAEGTLAELQEGLLAERRLVFALGLGSDASPALDPLRALPGVLSAALEGPSLVLEVEGLDASLPAILDVLRRHGVGYGALACERPSLESVFLQKTGRGLRD